MHSQLQIDAKKVLRVLPDCLAVRTTCRAQGFICWTTLPANIHPVEWMVGGRMGRILDYHEPCIHVL